MTTVLAVVAEVAAWFGGASNHTETFAWFRVIAHLGPLGVGLAIVAGLVVTRVRKLPPPWLGALALRPLFWDLPQAQPDTATWFTLSQLVARSPTSVLHWASAAWGTEEARFHRPFPLVPSSYGLAFGTLGESPFVADLVHSAWAVALAVVVPWAASVGRPLPSRTRAANLAGWMAVTLPLLTAQSGWLLADLPLCVTVTLAWGLLLRARTARGLAPGLLVGTLAAATKLPGAAYVGAAALAMVAPLPLFFGAALLGAAVVTAFHPPRIHGLAHYAAAAGAIGLHLRPGAWVAAFAGTKGRHPLDRLTVAVGMITLGLVIWTPAEHAARYALPVGVALAMQVARVAPGVGRFLVGSGLVLLIGGYRPILVANQAVNLQEATRRLVESGVEAIEVQCDSPKSSFPPAAVAALVDYYSPVPVRTGPALSLAPPDDKRHWWEFVSPPPWRAAGPADGVLLALYGADSSRFEAMNPDIQPLGTVSRYRASSLLLPREVAFYRRSR